MPYVTERKWTQTENEITRLRAEVEQLTLEKLQFKKWWTQERARNEVLQNRLDAALQEIGDGTE